MAYGQMAAITRRRWEPDMSSAVLANAPMALEAAKLRDAKAQEADAIAENARQFSVSMDLQRQQMDQNQADAKRASVISALGILPSSAPLWMNSGAKEAITTPAAAAGTKADGGMMFTASELASKGMDTTGAGGLLSTVKSGASNLLGKNVASGISMKGLGLAGTGAIAGAALGKNDLQRGLIGAGVPLAFNVGSALLSGGNILGAVSSSLLPSLGGGLGAIGLKKLF